MEILFVSDYVCPYWEMIGLLADGQSAAAGGFSCGPDGC